MTAANLRRVAAIVRVLEDRGEDLSGLRIGLMPYLRQIAHGQILPEVVVRFGGAPRLMTQVARLPLPDQRRLVDGGRIELAVRRGSGIETLLVDPLHLTGSQLHQAFGRDQIREIGEQIALLEATPADPEHARPKGSTRIDRRRGGVKIGGKFVTQAELRALLAELAAGTQDAGNVEDFEKTVPVKLTEAEHRALRQASLDTDTSMTILIRRAMKAAGLI